MENSRIEGLVVAQALYKVISDQVSTKNPYSLRSEADAHYKALYEATGSKSFDVMLGDEPVGTYSVRFSKAKPAETKERFIVSDMVEFARWFDEQIDGETAKDYAALHLEEFASWYFSDTGEVPDGCEVVTFVEPELPKQYIGGLLKVDEHKVAERCNELGYTVAGLLGAADE